MIAIKIGIYVNGLKYEKVLNASILLDYFPWLVRRVRKLKA
jgi:hypothetical protein